MNAQQLNEIVDALELDKKAILGIGKYTKVEIDRDIDNGVIGYSWTLYSEKFPFYTYPSAANQNNVKTFKTIGGAKRNLKKYLSRLLEHDHA